MSTNLKIWYKMAYVTGRTNRLKTQHWKILNSSKVSCTEISVHIVITNRWLPRQINQQDCMVQPKHTNSIPLKITIDNLKFRPIIDQIGSYTYKTAQIIGEYLRPLSRNEYTIKDTQQFPDMIKNLPPLPKDKVMFRMMSNRCLPMFLYKRQLTTWNLCKQKTETVM